MKAQCTNGEGKEHLHRGHSPLRFLIIDVPQWQNEQTMGSHFVSSALRFKVIMNPQISIPQAITA
jgi:hypothetical protein